MRLPATLSEPLLNQNPITVQVLGLCSALAVTSALLPALIMSVALVAVLVFSSVTISAIRGLVPQSIRLIIQVTIIASAVIIVDEVLKAYFPDVSRILSVFVGLIITNCIVLARVEGFAMRNGPFASGLDALGNGLGYSAILILIGATRELLGSGTVLSWRVLSLTSDAGWYPANELMLLAPSAFFLVGLVIWALQVLSRRRGRMHAGNPNLPRQGA